MSTYSYKTRKNQTQDKKPIYSVDYHEMAAVSALTSTLQSIEQNKCAYDTNEMIAIYSAAFMGSEI